MGKIGKCCCVGDCYVIPPEELPTITIPGWVEVGGTSDANGCCKCFIFERAETPAWTELCSDIFGTATIDWRCEADVIAEQIPELPIVTSPDCTPVTSNPNRYCCATPVTVGTQTTDWDYTETWRLFVRYRPHQIYVCITKKEIDCGGVLQTKWIVHSRYCYLYERWYSKGTATNTVRDIVVTNTCFEKKTPVGGVHNCDVDSSTSRPAGCTYEDMFGDGDGVPVLDRDPLVLSILEGVCFDRVEFFDDIDWFPSSITFDNTSLPGSCEYEMCGKESSFITQLCFSISSWPCKIRPCWCSATYTLTEIVTEVSANKCGPGSISVNLINPPDCDAVGVFINCGELTPACTNYFVSCFVLNVSVPDQSIPDNCCECGSGSSGGRVGDCFPGPGLEFASVNSFGFFICTSQCDAATAAVTCIQRKPDLCASGGACGTACCYSYDCNICSHKFGGAMVDATLLDIDITCTINPVSLCINAPTWTINLA